MLKTKTYFWVLQSESFKQDPANPCWAVSSSGCGFDRCALKPRAGSDGITPSLPPKSKTTKKHMDHHQCMPRILRSEILIHFQKSFQLPQMFKDPKSSSILFLFFAFSWFSFQHLWKFLDVRTLHTEGWRVPVSKNSLKNNLLIRQQCRYWMILQNHQIMFTDNIFFASRTVG